MYKLLSLLVFILFATNVFSQQEFKKDLFPIKGTKMIKYSPLVHSTKDSIYYIVADTSFVMITDPLEHVSNVGLRFVVRSLDEVYKPNFERQDSLQNAVSVLINYVKNDSVRNMVKYIQQYIQERNTEEALRKVRQQIILDSLLSYDPDESIDLINDGNWEGEALSTLYKYVNSDSVNQWIREISRDSVEFSVRNMMNDSLSFWINNGKEDYKRFWLKKSKKDSIGVWIQNINGQGIKLFVDDDVYQESVRGSKTKGNRVKLEELLTDSDFVLRKIQKRERYKQIWKMGANFGLGFNQGHVANWAKGGESSVAGLATIDAFVNYSKGNSSWESTLKVKYGLLKSGDNELRKNEDRLELNTKYGQKAFNKWYYSFMMNAQTEMFNGYSYVDGKKANIISKFFAPGYLLTSIGLDYKPNNNLSILLSPLAGKWTFVRDTANIDQTKYGVDANKLVKDELGSYVKIIHKYVIFENISINNIFQLYSNYSNKAKNIDIDWEFKIDFPVNQYLSTSISTHLISDDDTGSKVQFKENFSIGLKYRL